MALIEIDDFSQDLNVKHCGKSTKEIGISNKGQFLQALLAAQHNFF